MPSRPNRETLHRVLHLHECPSSSHSTIMSSRRPAPRPNRAGEAFTRNHHLESSDGPPSSKKPRFDVRNPSALAPDAPEEDAILDLDEIGKGGQRTKRSA